MSQMIYGVFETRNQADEAIEAIEEATGHHGVNALIHEGHMRDEDIQMSGTLALKGAVAGAVVVGCAGALIGALLLLPNAGMNVGWAEFVFMAVAGTIMGVTAGAVAGASEPNSELLAVSEVLDQGKVLVTAESDAIPAAAVVMLMTKHGATKARAA